MKDTADDRLACMVIEHNPDLGIWNGVTAKNTRLVIVASRWLARVADKMVISGFG